MASSPLPDNSHNSELPKVTYDLQEFQASIFLCLIGLMLIVLFVQILDRIHYWLQLEVVPQLDIESGQITNNHPSLNDNFDWSGEQAALNNIWIRDIVNGFMTYLAEKQQVPGPSQELLELISPCVKYESLENTTSDGCVICLDGFEDDEICRVFPVCNHVFHIGCIDTWLRDNITCPICRNCIVDSMEL